MSDPTWQERESRLRATWSESTSRDDRVRGLTTLLGEMLGEATIAEGRALAEEAFELALAVGDEVSESNANEAFLCLGDVYDELGLDAEKARAAERWEKRFGIAPPPPVFGLFLGNDGSVDILTSPEEVERLR